MLKIPSTLKKLIWFYMEHFTTNQVSFEKHLNEMAGQLQSLNSTEFPPISD